MQLKKHFNECIEQIDFDRIESVMKYLDWKWYMLEGEPRVPNKLEMINVCKSLFKRTKKLYKQHGEQHFISTGGFTVSVDKGYVKVDFSLTEGVSYDEEDDCKESFNITNPSDYEFTGCCYDLNHNHC